MEQVMVRYKVKPEQVAANEGLVRDVYDELDGEGPSTFHYATFKLADGVSFVHISANDGADRPSPLPELERSSVSRRTLTGVATNTPSSAPLSRSARTDGFPSLRGPIAMSTVGPRRERVIHLELHTGDSAGASAFYASFSAGARVDRG